MCENDDIVTFAGVRIWNQMLHLTDPTDVIPAQVDRYESKSCERILHNLMLVLRIVYLEIKFSHTILKS